MKGTLPALSRYAKPIRHFAEYLCARAALGMVNAAPPRVSQAFGHALADLAFVAAAQRRRIACANLLRTGLAQTPAQARQLARQSFRHLADVALESVLCARRLTADTWQEAVELELPDATRRLLDDPAQGIIVVTGHVGNWEVGGHLLSFLKPVTAVARRMNNPRTQALFDRYSARGRLSIVPKRQADPRMLVRTLRQGRLLGLLMDQHARGESALKVPFFGHPAAMYATPARLQRLTGAPIIFQYALRTGRLRYRMVISEPLVYPATSDPRADRYAVLLDLNQRLEAAIRQAPGQYLWAHRRWR